MRRICSVENVPSVFDDDTGDKPAPAAPTGPRKRTAKDTDVRCFESFGKFKRAMTKEGLSSKRNVTEWHHVVAQHSDNKKKFGEYDLHCTDNVILITTKEHRKENSHYTTKRKKLGEQSLRDWLKPKDFDEQYTYGIDVLQRLGIHGQRANN